MKLLNGYIALIANSGKESKSAGGLYLASVDTNQFRVGVVKYVGKPEFNPHRDVNFPTYVVEGDRVLFNSHYFNEISVDGINYFIGKESQLLAILD